MSAPPNRQYSRFIVTADVWPTTREDCQAKADAWQGAADASSAAADTHRAAINGLRAEGVAQSRGFDAMHEAYWRNQVKADNLTDTRRAAADLMNNIAETQYGAEQRIDSIDAYDRQLASVPSRSPLAIGIITGAAAMTRWTSVGAADEIIALSGNFASRLAESRSVRPIKTISIAAMVASDLHRRQSPRPRRLPTTLEVLDALTHLSDKEALGVPVTLENPLYQRVSVMSGRL